MKFIGSSISVRALALSAIGLTALFAAQPANAAFIITPTFTTNITSDPNSAAIQASINSAIAVYQSTFTDNMTVRITFDKMSSGLGMSSTAFTSTSYTNYHALLIADGSTPDDATALAQLAALPYGGNTIDLSTANARAIGIAANPTSDGTVSLNTGACFLNHNSPVPGFYDLFAVACHEIDEVLGTSSGVGGNFQDTDLFRYNGAGARSFTTSNGVHAFFSINGVTSLVEYNQFNRSGGDFGDWVVHNPSQVQDFAGTPGVTVNLGNNELALLDVIGYNRSVVPEPASMVALGLGVAALIRRRRKS